jgi:hypothetical protein
MKVLKHCMYIQYRCGMQSVVVYSLNHDTTMSLGLRLTPIFQNVALTCRCGARIRGTKLLKPYILRVFWLTEYKLFHATFD